VIVVVPNDQQLTANQGAKPVDAATGQKATVEDGVRDAFAVYEHAQQTLKPFQTWGRQPQVETFRSSGSDEASQRADAVAIAAKKPFVVVDLTGGTVLASALAANKILVAGAGSNKDAAEQRPYRWLIGGDPDATGYLSADFIATSLAGRKARFAGDAKLATRTRSFGVVHPASFDIGPFRKVAAKGGLRKLTDVSYDDSDPSKLAEAATPVILKMKSAGVTSVVLLAPSTAVTALMNAADAQQYFPEWVATGYLYQEFDGFGRSNPPDQQRHYFGIANLPPAVEGQTGITGAFAWYWGDHAGVNWPTTTGLPGFVYSALHYSGPDLTPVHVEQGLFSARATGGQTDDTIRFQSGYGRTVGVPYNEYGSPGTDVDLIWWNGDITGGTQAVSSIVGKGKNVYLDGGRRYRFGTFPKKEPKFFDMSKSIAEAPISATWPHGVEPVAIPCPGDCPANSP